MKTSEAGIAFIQTQSPFRAEAHQLFDLRWSIGYGHITERCYPLPAISKERAAELFREDIRYCEEVVNRYIETSLTQSQFDATLSFVMEQGVGKFLGSHLFQRINKDPNLPEMEQEFLSCVNARGRRLPQLVSRREAEWQLYNTK